MNSRNGNQSNEKVGSTGENRDGIRDSRFKSPECGGSSSDPVWGGGANLAWPERSGLQSRSVYRKAAKIAKERKGKREKLEIGYWGRGIGD